MVDLIYFIFVIESYTHGYEHTYTYMLVSFYQWFSSCISFPIFYILLSETFIFIYSYLFSLSLIIALISQLLEIYLPSPAKINILFYFFFSLLHLTMWPIRMGSQHCTRKQFFPHCTDNQAGTQLPQQYILNSKSSPHCYVAAGL